MKFADEDKASKALCNLTVVANASMADIVGSGRALFFWRAELSEDQMRHEMGTCREALDKLIAAVEAAEAYVNEPIIL